MKEIVPKKGAIMKSRAFPEPKTKDVACQTMPMSLEPWLSSIQTMRVFNRPGPKPGTKRKVNRFPSDVKFRLEQAYEQCKYPTPEARAILAKSLGLNPKQVRFWFQNRRCKDSRTELDWHVVQEEAQAQAQALQQT